MQLTINFMYVIPCVVLAILIFTIYKFITSETPIPVATQRILDLIDNAVWTNSWCLICHYYDDKSFRIYFRIFLDGTVMFSNKETNEFQTVEFERKDLISKKAIAKANELKTKAQDKIIKEFLNATDN